MISINEAVIVEGKYDKIKLSSIVDGLVIETNGFRIFKDKNRLNLIRRLALERGIIILTDSDSAGFMIRNYLSCSINRGKVYHAYVPDVFGKEKRKCKFSKEKKIGVEGMESSIIENAIKDLTTNINILQPSLEDFQKIKFKFYELGFCGCEFSRTRRDKLKSYLDLPENLSTNSLIKVLIRCFKKEELEMILKNIAKGT